MFFFKKGDLHVHLEVLQNIMCESPATWMSYATLFLKKRLIFSKKNLIDLSKKKVSMWVATPSL